MKILTKEEEQAHYNATLKGGITGALGGLAVGAVGVYAASARFHLFRQLTVPFRAFLVTSSATFAGIIAADRASRGYEAERNPQKKYSDESQTIQQQAEAQKSTYQRALDWAKENRYSLIFGAWVLSMGTSFGLVSRNPYLTGQQKLVQARVYAQGLTLAVLVASFAFEANDANQGTGRWETVKYIDPNDPTHKHIIEKKIHHERYRGEDQWMDMVAAEEEKLKQRQKEVKEQEEKDVKQGKVSKEQLEKQKKEHKDDKKEDDKKEKKERFI